MSEHDDPCGQAVDNAKAAVEAVKRAIESVSRGVYSLNTHSKEDYDKRKAEVEAAYAVALTAQQSVWTADQSCGEEYPELYEVYGIVSNAATNCSTARVEDNYESYLNAAYDQLEQAEGKFPW